MRSSYPYLWKNIIALTCGLSNILAVMPALAQVENTAASDEGIMVDDETLMVESSEFIINNTAQHLYQHNGQVFSGTSNLVKNNELQPLTDPRGQVLGCGGELLPDYTGFTVALYDVAPNDPTQSELGPLLRLTRTERPDIPNNGIPFGISPNDDNENPYNLTNEDEGQYSFLLDRNRGQLNIGRSYILVVDPPVGNGFRQRRVRLTIDDVLSFGTAGREQVRYLATSLDGEPIGREGAVNVDQSVVLIEDADRIGLQLLALQFQNTLCNTNQLEIRKSGDRANAAPGDSIIYRLTLTNRSDAAIDNLSINDVLPAGFKFLNSTVQAEVNQRRIPIAVKSNGLNLEFTTPVTLPVNQVLTLVYAAQLTPDAMRGTGINSATAAGQRVDNDLNLRNGPATHRVRVSSGALSNCGTILGRVFVDHNFDGKQQPGEPGVPNAVVWMDDGNRITADEDGLFHVKCVLPGYRTGALDLTTLPGYTLAPNLKFIERNSPSRLVKLAPGGLVRMNFGVTPSFQEDAE